ncbi:hypothetical protein BaRGS_00000240, partial [Batillaria attramentaria]
LMDESFCGYLSQKHRSADTPTPVSVFGRKKVLFSSEFCCETFSTRQTRKRVATSSHLGPPLIAKGGTF